MNVSLVAERYAKALFELALEKNAAEEVYQDSLMISRACENSRELRLLLKSPVINSGKKLTILRELFEKNIHQITLTYMMIMVRKNRESFIDAIAVQFVDLYNVYRNILTVHFSSPVLPDEETRKQVLSLMEKYTAADIDLQAEIDESLVGGFVLKWSDKQYDASIRREIENIRNSIAKINLYKKGF
ncbi:MAG: ATP synthase F1 subunit delta [Bacteroidales bacterium]|nr:ATP synthase F1 subunit delta [Bacteroidales bacterium]